MLVCSKSVRFSVTCKFVYRWIMTHGCCTSDLLHSVCGKNPVTWCFLSDKLAPHIANRLRDGLLKTNRLKVKKNPHEWRHFHLPLCHHQAHYSQTLMTVALKASVLVALCLSITITPTTQNEIRTAEMKERPCQECRNMWELIRPVYQNQLCERFHDNGTTESILCS